MEVLGGHSILCYRAEVKGRYESVEEEAMKMRMFCNRRVRLLVFGEMLLVFDVTIRHTYLSTFCALSELMANKLINYTKDTRVYHCLYV